MMTSTFYSTRSQKFLCLAALVIAAVVSFAEAASIPAKIQQRPNIIVIQPDDHLFLEEWNPPARLEFDTVPPSSMTSIPSEEKGDKPAYISPVPNINRLRNNGLEMTNAYAASTMCGTSRYSTLTGRMPSRSAYGRQMDQGMNWYDGDVYLREVIIPRTKLQDAWGVEDAQDCTENNLAAILKQNGYSTGMVGKWHLEDSSNENGGLYDNYGRVQDKVRNCGFDFAEAIYRENLGDDFNVDRGYVTHNMEHLTSEAIRFIQESVGSNDEDDKKGKDRNLEESNEPFFLYFNPTVPHDSGDVTDALSSGNCRETVEGRFSEDPYIPYGMTKGGEMTCREYRQTVLDRAAASAATMDTRLDNDKMAGAVWVDDAIGSLVETLEALDQLDNTLILFQLDHGLVSKGSVFEGGSRIVQFIHYPDQIQVDRSEEIPEEEQEGWKFDGLVSTIDIAPTLMDLAGVPLASGDSKHGHPRYNMDGKSWFTEMLKANMAEEQAFVRQERQKKLIHENYFQDRCLFVEEGLDRAVRCGCYKYIYVNNPRTGFTAQEANSRGVDINTHNFYNLCDESTGSYINFPESSPELWSNADDQVTEEVKTKLMGKMECLLKQTNPSGTNLDYETDCGLPLHHDKDESSFLQIETSPDGKPDKLVIGAVDKEPHKKPPVEANPGLNKPPSIDVTGGSQSGESGDIPFLRSPTVSSKSSAMANSVPKSLIIVISLMLVLAPCFFYCLYREVCRRYVVGTDTDLYRQKEIEKNILQSAIKTQGNRNLEIGSTRIHDLGHQFEPDSPRNYRPTFWSKLADEMKRQAALRDKWGVYAVSGVVIGTSSGASVGTDTSSETSEQIECSLHEEMHEIQKPNEEAKVPEIEVNDEEGSVEIHEV